MMNDTPAEKCDPLSRAPYLLINRLGVAVLFFLPAADMALWHFDFTQITAPCFLRVSFFSGGSHGQSLRGSSEPKEQPAGLLFWPSQVL
ncbi:MAG TPA: hypothetical protein DCR55_11495 [Lentisphaeria bacterium]|jgi:hypothetical protein|nr:hypothetical protein [Lentisphaeria bacterium]